MPRKKKTVRKSRKAPIKKETRYVQRDKSGRVTGHFANPQPGYAEEELPEDHPDIKDYHNERKRIDDEGRKTSSIPAILKRLDELEVRLAKLEGK